MEDREFNIVEFVTPPILDFNRIVCVPKSWITIPCHNELTVLLQTRYPMQAQGKVKRLVRNYADWEMDWGLHDVYLKYKTRVYEDADRCVRKLLSQNHSDIRPETPIATTSPGHFRTKKQSQAPKNGRSKKNSKRPIKEVSFSSADAHTSSSNRKNGTLLVHNEITNFLKTTAEEMTNLKQFIMTEHSNRLYPIIEDMKAAIARNTNALENLKQNFTHLTELSYLISKFANLESGQTQITMEPDSPTGQNGDATTVIEHNTKEPENADESETGGTKNYPDAVLVDSNDTAQTTDKEEHTINSIEVNNTNTIEDSNINPIEEDVILLSDEEDTIKYPRERDNNDTSAQMTEDSHRMSNGKKRKRSGDVELVVPMKKKDTLQNYSGDDVQITLNNVTALAVVETAPGAIETTGAAAIPPGTVEIASSLRNCQDPTILLFLSMLTRSIKDRNC